MSPGTFHGCIWYFVFGGYNLSSSSCVSSSSSSGSRSSMSPGISLDVFGIWYLVARICHPLPLCLPCHHLVPGALQAQVVCASKSGSFTGIWYLVFGVCCLVFGGMNCSFSPSVFSLSSSGSRSSRSPSIFIPSLPGFACKSAFYMGIWY